MEFSVQYHIHEQIILAIINNNKKVRISYSTTDLNCYVLHYLNIIHHKLLFCVVAMIILN